MEEIFHKVNDLLKNFSYDYHSIDHDDIKDILILILSKLDKNTVLKLIEEDFSICCLLPKGFLTKEQVLKYLDKAGFYMDEFKNDYQIVLKTLSKYPRFIRTYLKKSNLKNDINFIRELVSLIEIKDEYNYEGQCPIIELSLHMKQCKTFYDILFEKIGERKITIINKIYPFKTNSVNEYLKNIYNKLTE